MIKPCRGEREHARLWHVQTILLSLLAMGGERVWAGPCARVSIQIEQEAVVTRTAFEAVLTITNEEGSGSPLENLLVDLEIKDADGNLANSRFAGLDVPELENISDVDGGGMIGICTDGPECLSSTETVRWLILPSDLAAPSQDPVEYFVGGEFSYVTDGEQITIPLFPVRIVVYPDAALFLKYFLQSPVFSDNPFTQDTIERAEPFSLGLMVENAGFGAARNFRITSAQPEITDNDRELLIAFELLQSQVGLEEVSRSFTVNMGDIAPQSTGVARWKMRSTLQGEFVCYNASFEHVNSLDVDGLSLIRNVEIMEMDHVVLLDGDDQPDFLVNARLPDGCLTPEEVEGQHSGCSTGAGDDVPDCVHSSDRTVLPIISQILDLTADAEITEDDLVADLVVNAPAGGLSYMRAEDPGGDQFRLISVHRSDGEVILVGETGGGGDISNAWTTHRWLPVDREPTHREDRLHLLDEFDLPGSYTYTLAYEPILQITNVFVNNELDQRSSVTQVKIEFSGETNVASLIANDLIVDVVQLWQRAAPQGRSIPTLRDIPTGSANSAQQMGAAVLSTRQTFADRVEFASAAVNRATGPRGSVEVMIPLTTDRYSWDDVNQLLTIDLTVDGPGGSNETLLGDANYELRIATPMIQSGIPGVTASLVDGDGIPDNVFHFGDHAIKKLFRFSGDGNGDRRVNEVDEALVFNAWLKSEGENGYNANADMNLDGTVNFLDLQLVRANWMNMLEF